MNLNTTLTNKENSFNSILPKAPLLENFEVVDRIGQGSFGTIYYAFLKNLQTKKETSFPRHYAIKIEKFDPRNQASLSKRTLTREAKFLYMLKEKAGFPKIYYCSRFADRSVLIMEKLGQNLEALFNQCERKFSLQTVLLIGVQALTRLEILSQKGIVHRDLKPENLLIGCSENKLKIIHLIDFGLSKKFLNDSNTHEEFRKDVGLIGTPRYTSVNSHLGHQQSRRDDLESLGYILVYFLKGKLPWMSLNLFFQNNPLISMADKNSMILQKKQDTPLEKLCENLPYEFLDYFKYVKNLKYEEEPNYQMLISKLRKIYEDKGNELNFDWETNINPKKSSDPYINTLHAVNLNGDPKNKTDFSENYKKNKLHANSPFESSIKKSSQIPNNNCEAEKSFQKSFENKINANFLNDVSNQDDELGVRNQMIISRKIICNSMGNIAWKHTKKEISNNLENLEDEEEEGKTQNLGLLMKQLHSQLQVLLINCS